MKANQNLIAQLNEQFAGVFDQKSADEVLTLFTKSKHLSQFKEQLRRAGYDLDIGVQSGVDDAEDLWRILAERD
ncbi:unnamed protein product [marine sediment metagenome]|uniref:Nif11 domain-containing protein n=1 Tax=marine sediment metagenome TaxID=412755 RepID=X0U425_9ZZZZ